MIVLIIAALQSDKERIHRNEKTISKTMTINIEKLKK